MKRLSRTALVVFSLICLAGAGLMQTRLLEMRAGNNRGAAVTMENASPLVVFTTVALSGLRGLVVDVLWTRITTLQWEEEDYVEIVQLSDWITKLEPRLGVVWDYHSFNMAYNISVMFSNPEDRWRWVLSGIRMLRDEALVYNPEQIMLYDRLCRIYRNKLIETTDPASSYYRAAWAKEMTGLLGDSGPDYEKLLADPGSSSRMRKEYKLEPGIMREIDSQYGPFDWRLPEPQIIYWAYRGGGQAGEKLDLGFDAMICQSMADTFRQGRVVEFRPSDNVLITDVRFDFLPNVLKAFDSALEKHNLSIDGDSPLRNTYSYFLRDAIVLLVQHGREQEAMNLFRILKERMRDPETNVSLEQYVEHVITSPKDLLEEKRKQLLEHHHH